MADLLAVKPLAIIQLTKHVAITTDADAQIHRPAPIIHTIHLSLAMVEQSRRLTEKAMKLKNQTTQGSDSWLGISGQGTVASIARLVVMNDGEQQTHVMAQFPRRALRIGFLP